MIWTRYFLRIFPTRTIFSLVAIIGVACSTQAPLTSAPSRSSAVAVTTTPTLSPAGADTSIPTLSSTSAPIPPDFTVTSTADATDASPGDGACDDGGGNCTLRAAIMEANAHSGADTISLASNGIYTLAVVDNNTDGPNGLPIISSDISINGNGATIQRSRAEGAPNFRIFHVANSGNLTLNDLTVSGGVAVGPGGGEPVRGSCSQDNIGGNTPGVGGGIFNNSGIVTLINSTVRNNSANRIGGGVANFASGTMNIADTTIINNTGGLFGGGFFNDAGGTVVISDATINGNSADHGGGIANFESKRMDLTGSQVNGNNGGGIFNNGGTATITATVVNSNSSGDGGGIWNGGCEGTVNISDTTISDNKGDSGAGIWSAGTADITNSIISGNTARGSGGGITNQGGTVTVTVTTISGNQTGNAGAGVFTTNGTFTLTESTLSGNVANNFGGGIYNRDALILTNSTVSGNITRALSGGGIYSSGKVTIINSTISDNSATEYGGGIFGTAELINTIIANNPSGGDCSGKITSLGHNLDSDGTCNLTEPTDLPNTNPLLGPLRQNGGPTFTQALTSGSPAIDSGKDKDAPTSDQRGVPRPRGSSSDIGAYEVNLNPVTPIAINDSYTVDEDGTLKVEAPGVLANESDPQDDPITTLLKQDVKNGTLVLDTDGAFLYKPNPDFHGSDFFTYGVTDGTHVSFEARVTIIVEPVSDTLTVTKTADTDETTCNVDCSLREAIAKAEPGDTIVIAAGTYTLTLGRELRIDKDLTLTGAGAKATIIEATTAMLSPGSGVSGFRVLTITRGNVSISGVTIRNGKSTGESAGISNAGTLNLTNSIITKNWANSTGSSGGIFNSGSLALTNSTVTENKSSGPGGGIGNSGTMTITNSTISGNIAFNGGGGGIYNTRMLTLINSTVSGNTTTDQNNRGGGGIANRGRMILRNSTVSGNSGILGGGIMTFGGSTTELVNTIVVNNPSGGNCRQESRLTSLGHNLDDDGTCTLKDPTDLSNTDPLLGPLQDNGGPSFTHALLPGSPAIDAGDDAACLDTDQRGALRPQGSACDIGAFEFAR